MNKLSNRDQLLIMITKAECENCDCLQTGEVPSKFVLLGVHKAKLGNNWTGCNEQRSYKVFFKISQSMNTKRRLNCTYAVTNKHIFLRVMMYAFASQIN